MKKYIIGFLAGCAFMTMATAFAEEVQSIIGKTVDNVYPVTVNGTELSTQAAVIDGSAYLPVRAVSDAIGLNVGFSETTGITLTEKEASAVADTTSVTSATSTSTTTPTTTSTNVSGQTKTTYKGLRAYIINGVTYYSPKDYNDLHPTAKVFKVSDGYTTIKKTDGNEIKIKHDDSDAVQFVEGETYINIKYYPE